MKSNIPTIVLAAALATLSLSCASKLKQKFLDEPYRDKEISAPLVITGIEISDARPSVDRRVLKIPTATFKAIGDTVSPPLTAGQEAVIKEEVARCAKGGGAEAREARVLVRVKEGEKQFSMGFFHSREYAKTKVTIELLDGISNPYLFSTSGEAYFEVKSIRADTLFLEELYRKAYRTSISKAFESVEEFLKKRAGK